MPERKRLYCHTLDDMMIWCVVAHDIPHAKKLLWADTIYHIKDICAGDYCSLTCKWMKEHDVSDMPIGMVDGIEGLKRGFFAYAEDKCPQCGPIKTLYLQDDRNIVCCSDCETKLNKEKSDDAE